MLYDHLVAIRVEGVRRAAGLRHFSRDLIGGVLGPQCS
jgi:hypothetical protein